MYKLFLTRKVEKVYGKLDAKAKNRINRCIDQLEIEPLYGPNMAKLEGKLEGFYRYRVGGIRVIYKVDIDNKIVTVMDVGSRGDVYK